MYLLIKTIDKSWTHRKSPVSRDVAVGGAGGRFSIGSVNEILLLVYTRLLQILSTTAQDAAQTEASRAETAPEGRLYYLEAG